MKCPICQQKMDLVVTSHKNKPFVDNNLYPKMCFACFSVPKTLKQTLDKEGNIKEQIELEYSIENLHSAQELFDQGSADNLNQAKKSVQSVKALNVLKVKKETKKDKPKLDCHLI